MNGTDLLLPLCLLAAVLPGCGTEEGREAPAADAPPAATASQADALAEATALPDTSDLGLPTARHPEAGKVYPVDEAPRYPALVRFRKTLFDAVDRRDTAALKDLLSPDIQIGFGGDNDVEAFFDRWNLRRHPTTSDLWPTLDDALRGGGLVTADGGFAFPAAAQLWDGDDPYAGIVITGQGVNVRAGPSLSADILAQVSYDVLERLPPREDGGGEPRVIGTTRIGDRDYAWTEIVLPDGRSGWVSDKFVASPVGFRGYLSAESGQWRLASFLSGD